MVVGIAAIHAADIRLASLDAWYACRPRARAFLVVGSGYGRHPAVALLDDGRSLREVATMLRADRNVLRDRLREVGAWPRPARVETPSEIGVEGAG